MNKPKDDDRDFGSTDCSSSSPLECSWCGEPLEGKPTYGNRIHPEELFCSRSHRDASTAAVKHLRDNVSMKGLS